MKKLFLITGLIMILLAGCTDKNDLVTITADPDFYTPSMSSVRGITMTPNFETNNSYEDIVYHWKTARGEFIGAGKETKNQGEAVIWSAVENDELADINEPFDINLAVIDNNSAEILAYTALTITPDNGFYKVEE
ncbi:MAG: hypothetical protein PHE79_06310 [Eubacteriales bacterium]|nr:hypothetical protein [Eubacteriales bacterium]